MSDDYIENINELSKAYTGEEMGADEILGEFHLYGNDKRAAELLRMDKVMKEMDTSNLRKVSELINLRAEMAEAHRRLRSAGR